MMELWILVAIWYVAVGVISCVICKPENALQFVLVVMLWPFLYVGALIYVIVQMLTSRK